MQPHRTTSRPIRKRSLSSGPLWIVAVLAVVLVAAILAGTAGRSDKHQGSVDATDGDPAFVVPSPVPTPRPLTLGLDLPALNDVQMKYQREAMVLPRLPIAFGVDKPPIIFNDNEAVVFVALLYSESNLNPYDEWGNHKVSSAGCVGIGQLCGSLLTVETRDSDEENIYAAAYEFRRLSDASGDVMEAVRSYKGVTTDDTKWQANSVFSVIRIAP